MPKRKAGRPTKKCPGLRNFKLCPNADKALLSISGRLGWTMTASVERALIFADSHADFGQPKAGR